MSAPVSVLSWIHNEERHMEDWLRPLSKYVSEIVLIDVGSTDKTVEIARKYTQHIYRRPFLLCGDSYRTELLGIATQPWVLWTYPDERWPEKTLDKVEKLISMDRWNSFSFMRHEYIGDVRVQFEKDGQIIAHGTPESPNWQTRLFKRGIGIFWTELVHAEYHGPASVCTCPPDLYFEHRKSADDQDFDNWRTYTWAKSLLWRYRGTDVEPYKTYTSSYSKMVRDSERLNLEGRRSLHMAEEYWQEWWKYKDESRVTLEEFEKRSGMSYREFMERYSLCPSVDVVVAES